MKCNRSSSALRILVIWHLYSCQIPKSFQDPFLKLPYENISYSTCIMNNHLLQDPQTLKMQLRICAICMRQIQHFWIFWSITQLLYHLFKIGQHFFNKKAFCLILKRWFFQLNYRPECPEVEDFAVLFASYIARILKMQMILDQLQYTMLTFLLCMTRVSVCLLPAWIQFWSDSLILWGLICHLTALSITTVARIICMYMYLT